MLQPSRNVINEADKIKFQFYTLNLLLPWLKEMLQEQNVEKEIEAKIQGSTVLSYFSCFSNKNGFHNISGVLTRFFPK